MARVLHQNELGWQTKFVNAIKDAGGYAQKTAHRTKVGVPDLLIKLPSAEAALIEVKHVIVPGGNSQIRIELTKPQALHLNSFTKAGGCAFWLAVLEYDLRRDLVGFLTSYDTTRLTWTREEAAAKAFVTARTQWQKSLVGLVHQTTWNKPTQ